MSSRRFYQALSDLVRSPGAVDTLEGLVDLAGAVLVALESGDVEGADELLRDAQARCLLESVLGRELVT